MRLASEKGTTLIEVVIASALLVTLMAGLMSMMGIAISTTENQGHLAARTTEYAVDKMEQLLELTRTASATLGRFRRARRAARDWRSVEVPTRTPPLRSTWTIWTRAATCLRRRA